MAETRRIFDFDSYKEFLRWRIEQSPKAGRGLLQKLAQALTVHSTLISHVLRGDKDFTSEQACLVAEFFGLGETEAEVLLAMVETDRAGNHQLKAYWQKRLDSLRAEHRTSRGRVKPSAQMTRIQEIEFHSSWEYSAVSLATSIAEFQTVDAIATRLGITRERVGDVLRFLIESGLCIEQDGLYRTGPLLTFLSGNNALLSRHHLNWRLKALQAHGKQQTHEFSFTMPLTISKTDRAKLKALLVDAVERANQLVGASGSEEVCCLTIDWFDVREG